MRSSTIVQQLCRLQQRDFNTSSNIIQIDSTNFLRLDINSHNIEITARYRFSSSYINILFKTYVNYYQKFDKQNIELFIGNINTDHVEENSITNEYFNLLND